MKTIVKYVVTAEESHGKFKTIYESEPLNTKKECQDWINENLPLGIQKCRTGEYWIEEFPSL